MTSFHYRKCDMCDTETETETETALKRRNRERTWLFVIDQDATDLDFCGWPCLAAYADAHVAVDAKQ